MRIAFMAALSLSRLESRHAGAAPAAAKVTASRL